MGKYLIDRITLSDRLKGRFDADQDVTNLFKRDRIYGVKSSRAEKMWNALVEKDDLEEYLQKENFRYFAMILLPRGEKVRLEVYENEWLQVLEEIEAKKQLKALEEKRINSEMVFTNLKNKRRGFIYGGLLKDIDLLKHMTLKRYKYNEITIPDIIRKNIKEIDKAPAQKLVDSCLERLPIYRTALLKRNDKVMIESAFACTFALLETPLTNERYIQFYGTKRDDVYLSSPYYWNRLKEDWQKYHTYQKEKEEGVPLALRKVPDMSKNLLTSIAKLYSLDLEQVEKVVLFLAEEYSKDSQKEILVQA